MIDNSIVVFKILIVVIVWKHYFLKFALLFQNYVY
jgi:hypothetical protein